jgi:hypothetical protein
MKSTMNCEKRGKGVIYGLCSTLLLGVGVMLIVGGMRDQAPGEDCRCGRADAQICFSWSWGQCISRECEYVYPASDPSNHTQCVDAAVTSACLNTEFAPPPPPSGTSTDRVVCHTIIPARFSDGAYLTKNVLEICQENWVCWCTYGGSGYPDTCMITSRSPLTQYHNTPSAC